MDLATRNRMLESGKFLITFRFRVATVLAALSAAAEVVLWSGSPSHCESAVVRSNADGIGSSGSPQWRRSYASCNQPNRLN